MTQEIQLSDGRTLFVTFDYHSGSPGNHLAPMGESYPDCDEFEIELIEDENGETVKGFSKDELEEISNEVKNKMD